MLNFVYDARIVSAVKTIDGRRYNARRKQWELPLSAAQATVEKLLPLGFKVQERVTDLIIYQKQEEKVIEEIRISPELYTGDLPLYDFQKIGATFLKRLDGVLLADVPGLGKTIQTIAALEGMTRVLVLCPASLKYQWEEEIKKWDKAPTQVIDGGPKAREKQWNKKNVTVFIANYELLLRDFDIINKFWDAIVCDEATRISNPKAKTTKALKQLTCKKRIALTGTPISNTPMDLWSIVDWISPGYLGSFWEFQQKYCIFNEHFGNGSWKKVSGYQNLELLAGKIAPLMLRRHKEEVFDDFPEKTTEKVVFELSPRERKVYDAVRNLIIAELHKLRVDGSSLNIIPVKLLRLKQITDDTRLITNESIDSSKLAVLKDLLEPIIASGEKAIVFTQFAKMADILYSELSELEVDRYVIQGSVSAVDRQDLVERFTYDNSPSIMIMTEAGAYGLNLQAASYVIHYDAAWSIAKMTQREDRAHRIGQKKNVTVYELIAKKTVDEYVAKVLHKKANVSKEILRDTSLEVGDIDAILEL